jgi:hypothetical protein
VQVNVVYRLSSIAPAIEHDAVAAFVYIHAAGQLCGDHKQMPGRIAVASVDSIRAANMLARYYQDVRRRLRVDIVEGDDPVILIYELRLDFAVCDFAK